MDIVSKHIPPDENGVRIATLDERSYRRFLWDHRPLRDFWRVGKGYETKLEAQGLYTMGDIARCSIGKPEEYYNEELLYRLFGVSMPSFSSTTPGAGSHVPLRIFKPMSRRTKAQCRGRC